MGLSALAGLLNRMTQNKGKLSDLSSEYKNNSAAVQFKTSDDGEIQGKIKGDLTDIGTLFNDLKGLESSCENPLNQMFCVEEFVQNNQGMCGMGMGMGGFIEDDPEGKHKIKLTGQELIALSTALEEFQSTSSASGQNVTMVQEKDFDEMVNKLKEAGVNASVSTKNGKAAIEITHKDGTKTVVFDANGNGGLDTQDYNFNKALDSFKIQLKEYQTKVTNIETQITQKETSLKENIEKHKDLIENIDKVQKAMETIDAAMTVIDDENTNISELICTTTETMKNIAESNSKQYAEDAKFMTNNAKLSLVEAEKDVEKITDATKKTEAQAQLDIIKAEIAKSEEQTRIAEQESTKAAEAATTEGEKGAANGYAAEQNARAAKEKVIASLGAIQAARQAITKLLPTQTTT